MAGSFRTFSIDPPWDESGGGQSKRGADRHYPLLKTVDIPRVVQLSPVWDPTPDAHLYLWTTSNFLMDGGWVMSHLGFRYVACVPWDKQVAGLGQYFRTRFEYLLFGVRGRGMEVRTDRRDVVGRVNEVSVDELRDYLNPVGLDERRTTHSTKPHAAFELIERRSRGPYCEVFARRPRPNWTSWGNEVAA